MAGNYLTDDQITAGAATLSNSKLTASQVDDLMSIFRSYLDNLAGNYPLRSTFEGLKDEDNNQAAKLAACLLLWQDVQFDNSAFAATNANRTGFTDSTLAERYDIFLYAFGLFWDLPAGFTNRFSNSRVRSSQYLSDRVLRRPMRM